MSDRHDHRTAADDWQQSCYARSVTDDRDIERPLFLVRHRPYLIRSVLLAVAIGMFCAFILANWAEQGG